MIERALELAMETARGAEISHRASRESSAEYEDDKLKRVYASQTTEYRVRVIVEDRLGSSSATSADQLEAAVARAIELAESGSEAKFDFPGPGTAPKVKTYDAKVEQILREELVAAGAEMRDRIKAYHPEIKVTAETGWSASEGRLLNSRGLDIISRSSDHVTYVSGMLVRGTDMLFAGQLRQWRKREEAAAGLADATIELFRQGERIAAVASKEMPVVFTPRGIQVLLLPLTLGVNGKNVLKGDSPLARRLGERIAASGFSLSDDATVDYAPRSAPYDDEGVPRRRNAIIEEGVLAGFLYDLETAAKAGMVSTGNGPGCGPSNLLVAPGGTSFSEMVKSMQEGIVVEDVLGLGQSNAINGDFSVNIALGYKVERGEIVGRVKDTMVAGNVYDALPRIEAIGSEPEWYASTCSPAVKVAGLSVVAKS